jgi:hypothetical protein
MLRNSPVELPNSSKCPLRYEPRQILEPFTRRELAPGPLALFNLRIHQSQVAGTLSEASHLLTRVVGLKSVTIGRAISRRLVRSRNKE